MSDPQNELREYWSNYEIQNPDGSWTTVQEVLTAYHKAVVEGLPNKMKSNPRSVHFQITEEVNETIEEMERHLNTIAKQHGLTQQHSDERESDDD